MKCKIAALIVASLLMTGCGGETNVGVINIDKVMTDAPQVKAIMDEGAQKMTEVQTAAAAEFENNPDWTEEEINKAQADVQRKILGIDQAYATQFKHKLDEVLSVIAQEKKLDVVVDSSSEQPIILKGGIDVTDEVIQKLQ